jgi:hypothetical protein
MKRLAGVLVGSILLGLPVPGEASKPVLPGAAPLGISLWAPPESQLGPSGELEVAVFTWADGMSPGDIATATIEVGEGVEVLGGDIIRQVHPSSTWSGAYDRDWRLSLRCPRGGTFVVRASLRFAAPTGDVTQRVDWRTTFRVVSGVVRVEDGHRIVAFGTIDGRRVRYGGRDLVAMDPDELELPDRIESPPAPLDEVRVECRGCTLPEPIDVPLLLTIGKGGMVTWLRRSSKGDAGTLPEGVWAAIEQEVGLHRFRPARAAGKLISDNLEIQVRVVPAR